MAIDATGTPTSPDNIPTFLVGTDAPTGNGTNAMMAQIQTIISGLRVGTAPGGRITASSALTATGTPSVNTFLAGNDTWKKVTASTDIAATGTPSASTYLAGDDTWKVLPASATELYYGPITATPAKPGGVGAANRVTVLSPGALTFDGGSYLFHFYSPQADNPGGNSLYIELYEGATALGIMGNNSIGSMPVNYFWRYAPSAGSHTFTVTQWNSGNFPYGIVCGGGGANTLNPAFLRITKVS